MAKRAASVRYDENKLDLAKKETGQPSLQKVLNFFLDSIWFRHNPPPFIELKQHKVNPVAPTGAVEKLEEIIKNVAPTGLSEKNNPAENNELPDFYFNDAGWKIKFKPDYSKMPKGLEFNERQEWMKNAYQEQLEKFHKIKK